MEYVALPKGLNHSYHAWSMWHCLNRSFGVNLSPHFCLEDGSKCCLIIRP